MFVVAEALKRKAMLSILMLVMFLLAFASKHFSRLEVAFECRSKMFCENGGGVRGDEKEKCQLLYEKKLRFRLHVEKSGPKMRTIHLDLLITCHLREITRSAF